jgi:hypothetical protein
MIFRSEEVQNPLQTKKCIPVIVERWHFGSLQIAMKALLHIRGLDKLSHEEW